MATTEYDAEVRHDGRLHAFVVPDLQLPICQACGEKVFTVDVDRQINDALRLHLKILTPAHIRAGISCESSSRSRTCEACSAEKASRGVRAFRRIRKTVHEAVTSGFHAPQEAMAANDPATGPILLWIDRDAGHGAGKPLHLRIGEAADRWSFLMWQTGMLE